MHLNWIWSLGRWRQCVVSKCWNIQPPRGAQTPQKNAGTVWRLVFYGTENVKKELFCGKWP
jgi:hypothetical protein